MGCHRCRGQNHERHDNQRLAPALQDPGDDRRVAAMQRAHQRRLHLGDMAAEQQARECRRDRERRDEAAGDGVGVGACHRAEDVPFDAGHREQRHEARDDDRRREQDRLCHFGGGLRDHLEFAAPAHRRAHAVQHRLAGTVRGGALGQVAKDVLHHDDRRVHDEAEVDRAHRQQVGRFAAPDHQRDGECERERDGRRDDHRAAQVAEKCPLQEEDQHHAQQHVVQHGVRRQVDELAAVVDLLQPVARRQDAARIDVLDLLLDALDRGLALGAATHENDALHDVAVAVASRDAQPRLMACRHVGHVAQANGCACIAPDQGVQQRGRRFDQPDPAHDDGLRANVDRLAAHVGVARIQRLHDLRQRHVEGCKAARIDGHVVDLGLAAPAGDVDHPGHRLEAALERPVLQRLEVGRRRARRPDDAVSVDLADRARRRNLGLRVVGQRRQLRQPVVDPLLGLLVAGVVGELHLHVGQAEQGDRAHARHMRQARHLDLDGDRDVALELLRGLPRALGHDIDRGRHRIRIGLDVELPEADSANDESRGHQRHDQDALAQGEIDHAIHDAAPSARASTKIAPRVTTRSPGFRPDSTSVRTASVRPSFSWRSVNVRGAVAT